MIEACSTAYAALTDGLSLEDTIQRYAASENESKRLGVTKDDIAAVDLVIRQDGREWIPEDYQKSESFAEDPVVSEAVTLLRQTVEEQTSSQGMTMGGIS